MMEAEKKKKGLLATIWESMTKSGGCCGGGGSCCGSSGVESKEKKDVGKSEGK